MNCPECTKQVVELEDGWVAELIQHDLWVVNNSKTGRGLMISGPIARVREYLKGEMYNANE